MTVEKIENIEQLILLEKDKKIIDYKVKRLTAPGDNYGSLMLSVDVTLKTPSGNKELHLVAKMVPPNEFIQQIFNTQVTFRNEIGFYKHVVPLLQEFQREHGVREVIDFSSRYYGSRLNLADDDNAKVDLNGALVLENLKVAKFVNLERTEGFNLDVAELVLTDLAHLHAVSLALKLQKPEIFEKEVKTYLSPWRLDEQARKDMVKDLARILDCCQELKPFEERVYATFNNNLSTVQQSREPFATLTHNDCWVNNVMVKMENGKAVKSKLVDFQVCDYGSPAKDILFFLFSSVKTEVLRDSYDHLIKHYFDTFTSILEKLKCDISPFGFEAFEKEIDFEAKNSQFAHVTFMLFPIFLKKEDVKELSELNADNMSQQTEISDLHKEKFTYIVKEFVKRNWI